MQVVPAGWGGKVAEPVHVQLRHAWLGMLC